MAANRPAIPLELRRQVLIEAGYRCAVPTCRQHPVDIDHIVDWAEVQKHEFENLIALCPTCHRRKGSKPGQIDRAALRHYKANLSVLNNRYGDIEKRLIEAYAERRSNGELLDEDGDPYNYFLLGGGSEISVRYLIRDGYLEKVDTQAPAVGPLPLIDVYQFTESGTEFVDSWAAARPLEPLIEE
ncbi:HNH endonuclease [Amycolatopsis lexingtonensis]|uniref:HNH endonuclease n=1 Tax=Amycolatopsis lexingtonensis TaxID=218822 RepID=UPI003F6FD13F